MNLHLKAFLYRILIDPLLLKVRDAITEKTDPSEKVIDIACGTGTLAIALARRTGHVTAIDLGEELISYASERSFRKGLKNISFEVHDATDLSKFRDKEFSLAVTSMAVHQFESQLAVKILTEMKRIASRTVIADYNFPLPQNIPGKVAYNIEKMAGGDHYRNFRNFMNMGGIDHFAGEAGLEIRSSVYCGGGVFVVVECS